MWLVQVVTVIIVLQVNFVSFVLTLLSEPPLQIQEYAKLDFLVQFHGKLSEKSLETFLISIKSIRRFAVMLYRSLSNSSLHFTTYLPVILHLFLLDEIQLFLQLLQCCMNYSTFSVILSSKNCQTASQSLFLRYLIQYVAIYREEFVTRINYWISFSFV
ncbi:Hypothetical_protein [Hexamita inflata]|uniref:Hypothetical_protein n=1 Tax=Hexamita inflata TaxID=28002 RepID=A0AA86R7W4_9EUKA|nr:Hypothetical protein HINF_LOCUS4932 [Hexamita inflata]CAI9945202.1 Hypothetical protein HINF_LOCUS32847 [Hexamita inflata]CAI9973051.1 Hypothetical protein HINF_LOCUS60696 [Hexamita inflata]